MKIIETVQVKTPQLQVHLKYLYSWTHYTTQIYMYSIHTRPAPSTLKCHIRKCLPDNYMPTATLNSTAADQW